MENEKKSEEKKLTFDDKVRILGQVSQDMARENVDLTIAMLEFTKQSIVLDYIVSVREKINSEEKEEPKAKKEEIEEATEKEEQKGKKEEIEEATEKEDDDDDEDEDDDDEDDEEPAPKKTKKNIFAKKEVKGEVNWD